MLHVEPKGLYSTWAPGIRRYLARLVGEAEADDLAQEVFVRACRGLSRFRAESRVSTWLYRIATHVAIDRLRAPSFQRQVASEGAKDPDVLAPANAGGQDDPESRAARGEMRRCILDVVAELPQGQRAVLLLSEVGGLTDREAAIALGVSLEAAKIRLHRARQRLRSLLQSRCDFYRDDRNEFACEPQARPRP